MADTWTVTAWRCQCHHLMFRRYPYTDRRWYASHQSGMNEFEDVAEIRRYHPALIPIEVSDVAALLADVYEATSRALPVLLHAWDGIATALGLATLPPAEPTPVGGE